MLVGGLSTGTAQADEVVEEIKVWGTKVHTSSLNLDEEAVAVRQVDHISDLLRTLPGIDVGGAHSMNQRITIRSMDDKDLRITIDGANQNTYMYHHMGNLQIHADILSAAELDLGNNSVIQGGLGGTVRFQTKSAEDLLPAGKRVGARLQAGYADNAASSYSATAFGQLTDDVDVLGYVNRVNKEDFKVGDGEIRDFYGDVIPNTDGTVRGFEGTVTDALIKLGWQVTANQRLRFGYESYVDKGDYTYRPDMGLATDLTINNGVGGPLLWPTEFARDTVTLNYDLTLENSTVKATLYSTISTLDRDETGWAPDPAAGYISGEAKNVGLDVIAVTRIAGHELTYGGEIIEYDTEYNADYLTADNDNSGESATTSALYLQDRIALGSRFALVPGLRFSHADLDSAVVKDSFSEVTGALALEFHVTDDLLIHASSTQLFKAPEIGEVFTGAGLLDASNPDIKAETGINNELAFAWRNSHYNAGVTVFETSIDNYIYDYAENSDGDYVKSNVGDMTIDGFEAYAGFSLGSLDALLTFSRADSELDAFATFASLDGARIDRKQGDTWSLNVDYEILPWNLALHWETQLVDDLPRGLDLDGATENNAKEGFTIHNIAARWTPQSVRDGWAFTFGVDNLFDEYYASQSSRTGLSSHRRFGLLSLQDYEPGRNVKATVSYQF